MKLSQNKGVMLNDTEILMEIHGVARIIGCGGDLMAKALCWRSKTTVIGK